MLMQVNGFRMPGYVGAFEVIVSTFTSANLLIDNSEDQTFSLTSTPGNLQMTLS